MTQTSHHHVQPLLSGTHLSFGYRDHPVAEDLNVQIPQGVFTAIIGPNGCGKSTLLRTLCRLLTPQQGEIVFDGKALHHYSGRELARKMGLLAQSAVSPEGISVQELVARGRYPHQSWLRGWGDDDEAAVHGALQMTGLQSLANHKVDALSGGQRQRVWVAMVLAQQTPLILLDEPTTYLDISHQIELLELFHALNQQTGRTLVAVLHDINQACRYAGHLIAMRDGRIIAEGEPGQIVNAELLLEVFGLRCSVIADPVTGTPLILPHRAPLQL